jgi:hypothetical protein
MEPAGGPPDEAADGLEASTEGAHVTRGYTAAHYVYVPSQADLDSLAELDAQFQRLGEMAATMHEARKIFEEQ